MILLTVGTELPFDRLVRAVDTWAEIHTDENIMGQIGPASYRPRNFQSMEFLSHEEYRRLLSTCTLVVAHAGMGAIISALGAGKPILVMPRKSAFREHRNDHQLATAEAFEKRGFVHVAHDAPSLQLKLDARRNLEPPLPISPDASTELVETIRGFISE